MKKIRIGYSFVIVVLLAFMIGLNKEILYLLQAFLIHELGHILFFKTYQYKINKITIFPFGGVIDYENKNDFLYKEILVTIAGIVFNYLFFLIFSIFNLTVFATYNLVIAYINILPIYPLDGGRVLLYLFSYLIPYRLSKFIIYFLSIFICLFFLVLFIIEYNGFLLILIPLLFIRINIISLFSLKRNYESFILKKYLYPNAYFKNKSTSFWVNFPINNLFYQRYMIFKYDDFLVEEETVLRKHYRKKEELF